MLSTVRAKEMTPTRTTIGTFLPGVLALALILCSCRPSGSSDEAPLTGEKMKTCFKCNGTGKMKCPDCRDGEVDCPGHCLKLTQGTWIHMDVAGHPPTDVWQKFKSPDGGGWDAFNQNHVGHIIELRNGEWADTGPCPICHGTGKVPCPKCNGTGEVVCDVCDGKKVVPESWTALDNPKMKNRPVHFIMKDGRTLIGRKIFVIGNHATIQTATTAVEVNTSDIVSESKPDLK